MRLGVELEGFVYDQNGPVDVFSFLCNSKGKEEWRLEKGVVKTDAGKHMIEISLDPVERDQINQIPQMIKDILVQLPCSWMFIWKGIDGVSYTKEGLMTMWAAKERYRQIWKALEKEVGEKWVGVLDMCRLASTHVHLEISPNSPQGIQILNLFNRPNPLFKWCSETRKKIWQNGLWADVRRLPRPRQFESPEHLFEFWDSIPSLLSGERTFPDPLREGTTWWWARPRWSLGTVEIRIADSMSPDNLPEYINELLWLIKQ
ncbi:MAG: hypothetical protein ACPLZH_02230 [Minisyncoccales bacterium]